MKWDNSMKPLLIVVLMMVALIVQGCGLSDSAITKSKPEDNTFYHTETDANEKTDGISEEELLDKEVRTILDNMTLKQKIFQMFIVTPEALVKNNSVIDAGDVTQNLLQEYPVGGLVFFTSNLICEEQTAQMLQSIQKLATATVGLPAFLCVDEEGGRVARIGNNDGFQVPKVGAMGDIKSAEQAYTAGDTIGQYLKSLGFNLDFAPDADVLTNKNNSAIGNRSFGSDPYKVLSYASEFSNGLHKNGILSTFKHFPGHGGTEADTHEGMAYTNKTYEELLHSELVPFAGAGKADVDFIMLSHICVPKVTGDDTPCSLSYQMATEILREELGYEGLVITDAMNMGAIVQKYTCEEATVSAIMAGADIVLMPENLDQAVQGVLSAVEDGDISEARIEESVARIIKTKLQMER